MPHGSTYHIHRIWLQCQQDISHNIDKLLHRVPSETACLNPSFSPKARNPEKRPNTMSFNSRNIRKRIKRTCQMCTSGDSSVVCPPSVQKSSQKTRKGEEEILAWGTSRASRASRSLGKEFSTSSFRKFYHVSWTASTLRTHYGQDIPKQMSVRIKECH